jgi:NADPH:quinone reductase-like Zn-dependent oxidoreductase
MKAVVYTAYGPPDGLHLTEVATPTPADDEVLVKVQAVAVNRSDWEYLIGKPLYARILWPLKPRAHILGSDIAGRVERAGRTHRQFHPGDLVFGEMWLYHGGFAEYVCTQGSAWALKPPRLTFEQAAAIPQAGVIALQGIREHGQVRPGQHVLINGAGGGAGSFAVQLAKLDGAEVTGVDHPGKLDFLRSLGADHVLDYTREDFTNTGQQYDLILDLVAQRSVFAYQRALKPAGRYFAVGGSVATLVQIVLLGPWMRRATGKHLRVLGVQRTQHDLLAITELCAAGKIVPVIDRRYPLRAVPEALRYLGAGHVKGKVVITVDETNQHLTKPSRRNVVSRLNLMQTRLSDEHEHLSATMGLRHSTICM